MLCTNHVLAQKSSSGTALLENTSAGIRSRTTFAVMGKVVAIDVGGAEHLELLSGEDLNRASNERNWVEDKIVLNRAY